MPQSSGQVFLGSQQCIVSVFQVLGKDSEEMDVPTEVGLLDSECPFSNSRGVCLGPHPDELVSYSCGHGQRLLKLCMAAGRPGCTLN